MPPALHCHSVKPENTFQPQIARIFADQGRIKYSKIPAFCARTLPSPSEYSDSTFCSIIGVVLLQGLLLKIAATAIPFGDSGSPAFSTYRRCRQWMEEHLLELNSLEQIAQQCHLDPAYLCRLFQRFDHQSPYQYLLKLKMQHATRRLQIPGVPVKEVGDELGFADPSHFSRAFKKQEGLSPAQFAGSIQRD